MSPCRAGLPLQWAGLVAVGVAQDESVQGEGGGGYRWCE